MSPRSTLTAATLTLLLGSASANGLILYGIKANGFKFSPEIVYANVGDILEFHFEQYNHSVVMGDWNTACAPAKTGGFYSGFIPSIEPQSENSTYFRVLINNTDPIVFYCSQNNGEHCKNGMVGAVNAKQEALDAYKCKSNETLLAVSPPEPFGGTFYTPPPPSPAPTTASVQGYGPPGQPGPPTSTDAGQYGGSRYSPGAPPTLSTDTTLNGPEQTYPAPPPLATGTGTSPIAPPPTISPPAATTTPILPTPSSPSGTSTSSSTSHSHGGSTSGSATGTAAPTGTNTTSSAARVWDGVVSWAVVVALMGVMFGRV